MNEPTWITKTAVLAIHDEQLAEHGGLPGIRDEGALESALARPQNRFHYEKANLIELAAAYAFGLTAAHAFVDGNKRVSMVVTDVFLALNGADLVASNEDIVQAWLALAAGRMGENEFAAWIRCSE